MAIRLAEIVVIGVLVLGSMQPATAKPIESTERYSAVATSTGDEENRHPAVD